MPLTLELPEPLSRELNEEASREGISPTDHATFLLYIATALHDTGKMETPFQNAVKSFLASRSIDLDHLSVVFEELVDYCLVPAGDGKTAASLALAELEAKGGQEHPLFLALGPLVDWKNAGVHLENKLVVSAGEPKVISESESGWPEKFFTETYGSLADDPLTRLPQGDFEEREAFE